MRRIMHRIKSNLLSVDFFELCDGRELIYDAIRHKVMNATYSSFEMK